MSDWLAVRRERAAKARRLEAEHEALETAVAADIRARLTYAEIAAKRGLGRKRVALIAQRLEAEGAIGTYYKAARQPDEVQHEVDDARARAVLLAHKIQYRSVPPESLDNIVAAARNGSVMRMPVYGGSIAGACADAGQPVR